MSRIDDLVARLCPDGVERRPLGEMGTFVRGNGLQKADLRDVGVPAIHYGQVFTTYGTQTSSTKSFVDPELAARLRRAAPGALVIATTSENDEDVGKAVAWTGASELAVSGDAYIYTHSLDPVYVAYFFQSDQFRTQKRRFISGTKVKRLSGTDLARIQIPIPPLEVQREIVGVLDTFSELEAELEATLEAELEARRKQYAHYRDALLAFGERERERWVTLGDICISIFSGGTPLTTRDDYYGGLIPWLRTQEVNYADVTDTTVKITEMGFKNSSAKWVRRDSVIVAISGAGVTRGRAAVNKIPLTTNQHCCNLEIDESQAHYRYVYYWLLTNYDNLRSRGRGNRSDLNVGIIKDYPIALPPLEEQMQIARTLVAFDTLVNDLSVDLPAELAARRKQYEYYRDCLLAFEPAAG